jgi:dipeptidyl aminopeptidase/acylaminoacyl peptidase
MRKFIVTTISFLAMFPLFGTLAAEKKPLNHSVYDSWNKVAGECISNDGRWIIYVIEPQEGDSRLVLYNVASGKADTVARGNAPRISEDSRFVAFSIKPFFADTRNAKIAKKKPEEMPKDSLGLVQLGMDSVIRIPCVKSFTFPEKGAGWIAYQLEKEEAQNDSGKTRSRKDGVADAPGDDKEKKNEKGTTLVARELASGSEFPFPFVNEYLFSKNGHSLLFASTGNDSTVAAGVFLFSTTSRRLDTLSIGKGKYKQLAWDEDGLQAAYVTDRDTSKNKQRFFALYYWKSGNDSANVLADTTTKNFPARWLVSENRTPSFSKNGKKLLFGTAPVPMPEDTTMNDEVTAKLDVWNWQDEFLQTQQLHDLDEEQKRSYLATLDLASQTFVQLATRQIPNVTVGDEGNADVAIGLSDVPYRKMVSWEALPFNDVYVVDVRTGIATMVLERLKGSASLSPRARFACWYDMVRRHWFVLDVLTHAPTQVAKNIAVPLYDELNDVPDDPQAHGMLGWTEGDSLLLIYDRYDIWSADPTGSKPAMNLTAGTGRAQKTSFRYVRTDPEERFIKQGNTLLLRTFDRRTKSAGFAVLRLAKPAAPQHLIMESHDFGTPIKAKNDSVFLYTRSSFSECPDLYVVRGTSFETPTRVSDINPQQKEYRWGTAELFSWKATHNTRLEGLLYKPENFDPKHKYPMLVYYYERNSDYLHRYTPPQPSRSIINPAYCVSNGYLVFIPDIRYRVGHPGKSAFECIVSGVRKLIRTGFVDPTRIGLQGQSWGGYQTAYLVTQTSMFRAAMAGAPVSNMTSAYGGIRPEAGMSRMSLYEKNQSRIGGTLWEKRDLFIENSPIFFADKVTTPLLIMANDNDGQVPWYQGIELFTALRRLGKQTWMLTYNGEAHNLLQRKNTKDLSIRMMQFFDHFLKDAPIPVWMKEGVPAINKGKTMGVEVR